MKNLNITTMIFTAAPGIDAKNYESMLVSPEKFSDLKRQYGWVIKTVDDHVDGAPGIDAKNYESMLVSPEKFSDLKRQYGWVIKTVDDHVDGAEK